MFYLEMEFGLGRTTQQQISNVPWDQLIISQSYKVVE